VKIFFFMGRNRKNKSGVSWKLWKIQRQGRAISLLWGPATLRRRKVVPQFLQSKTLRFRSAAAAREAESRRIANKLKKGYQRRT
jgi:predicted DNA-binding WGR domain protein